MNFLKKTLIALLVAGISFNTTDGAKKASLLGVSNIEGAISDYLTKNERLAQELSSRQYHTDQAFTRTTARATQTTFRLNPTKLLSTDTDKYAAWISSEFPNLTELSFFNCINAEIDPLINMRIVKFINNYVNKRNITTISLDGCDGLAYHEFIKIIQALPNLKTIDLSACSQVTDAWLAMIAHYCIRLESLDIRYCPQVTIAGVTHLVDECANLMDIQVGLPATRSRIGYNELAIMGKNDIDVQTEIQNLQRAHRGLRIQ